jgi:NitT/TauT family transport system substrate-binding protein
MISSKDYKGIITDIITARQDDLAANPKKYVKFLQGIYMAIDFAQKNPDKYAELAAPHFGLKPDEVKEILRTSLAYTPLDEAKAYLGQPGKRGKLHDIFDTVMQLNLENQATDNKLDSNQQIDNRTIQQVRLP